MSTPAPLYCPLNIQPVVVDIRIADADVVCMAAIDAFDISFLLT